MVKTKARRRRQKNNRKRTQKIWKMRGCANKKTTNFRGGSMSLSPSPFVNAPSFPGQIPTWPGVAGSATGNWLTKNQHLVDLTDRTAIQERAGQVFPLQMGGKSKKGAKSKKGGGLLDLVNMGFYGINSAYSNLVGAASMPINPMPTADQFQKRY